jgi:putative heme iron utilization protein
MGKVRKQIYLEDRQDQRLREVSEATGLSEAEIIRQLIDQQLRVIQLPRFDREVWEEEKKFIETLHARYQGPELSRTWRREDLYDR